jgi:phosphoribosylpyrophosphate synthetase
MTIAASGYSRHQFNHVELRATAQRIAVCIPEILQRFGADAVVVTGKSGMSVAFAAMMFADLPLVVVRKRGENSHGSMIEGVGGLVVRKYIILDDFVSSGETVRTIAHDMEQYANAYGDEVPQPVGVACYGSCYTLPSSVALCDTNGNHVASVDVFKV